MKRIDTTLWLCLGLSCFAAAPASAQVPSPATGKLYLNANVGEQFASRTLKSSAASTIYDETATLFATQPVNRGAVIDVGAGYRVWIIAHSADAHRRAASGTTSLREMLRPYTEVAALGAWPHVLAVAPGVPDPV